MNGGEILIPLTLFIGTAAVLISYFTSKHRERMKMIEKGLSAEDIKALYAREVHRDPLFSLKWGIIFVLGGAAILIGFVLNNTYHLDAGIIPGLVIVFVGIGLLLFYMIASKKS